MLRFSLIDFTTDKNGATTVIEEPVGWDAVTMRLKRSKDWHGFFDFFDDSASGLQFDNESGSGFGNGYAILKNAYETNGAEARVDLLIEFQCSPPDEYEELYHGRFNFSRYKDTCSERCFVEVGVETTSCIMTFKNRYDQKVDLDSLISFDDPCEEDSETTLSQFTAPNQIEYNLEFTGLKEGASIVITGTGSNDGTYTVASIVVAGGTTVIIVEETVVDESTISTITGCIYQAELESYVGLSKEIILPTKPLRLQNDWSMNLPATFNYTDDACPPVAYNVPKFYGIAFEWDKLLLNELPDGNPTATPYTEIAVKEDPSVVSKWLARTTGVLTFNNVSKLFCVQEVEVIIKLAGTVHFEVTDTVIGGTLTINLAYGDPASPTLLPALQVLGSVTSGNVTYTIDVDTTETISLANGESIWLYMSLANYELSTAGGGFCPNPFDLEIEFTEASLQMVADSFCEPTKSRVYLVNEVMSRCAEAYTNDCLRVYSDYFGRTDAQPYTSDEDGCGGLEAITSGLKIRAENDLVHIGNDDVIPKITVSMKEVFEALDAIHNIGMGPEEDPNRPGEELLRVEPVHYFYKDDVLMTCDSVAKVERTVFPAEIFSIFKVGYQKWETENLNGLNDVFTKREYRTLATTVRNTLEKFCKFIASDYAIEVTRRLYGGTTKDWKYDNDTFIVCLKNHTLPVIYEYIEEHTIKLVGYDIEGTFHIGDQVQTIGTGQDGTYDVTGVSIVGSDTILVVSQTVANESTSGVIINHTHPVKIVETDNVSSSTGLLYPDSFYNLRITPARNAMRHFKTILMSYRNYLDGILKFTNGDGNFLAQIEVDAVNCCLNENMNEECDCDGEEVGDQGLHVLPENTDIDLGKFSCEEDHLPIFWPERVKYDYPVTWQQYKAIRANPYGIIGFQCGDGEVEPGYIDDFALKPTGPNGGLATFTLKPKIVT